jgi:hypothetical protein
VLDGNEPRAAHASEIETIAAERLNLRFGKRFEKTLKRVSDDSILLSKLPPGIPLFLRCRERLTFSSAAELVKDRVEGITAKGREISDEAEGMYSELTNESPFGVAKGNTSILWGRVPVRFEEHYVRFTCYKADLKPDIVERFNNAILQEPEIVVSAGGGSYFCDVGALITEHPAIRVQLPEELSTHRVACIAWLKSSFFIWYCAVHLSDQSLYQQLQTGTSGIPFLKPSKEESYRRLGSLGQNVLIEEKRFLDEVQREMKRGSSLGQREKLRKRHNATLTGICLSIDREIAEALSFSQAESEFIARTLRDMELTDFGFLEKLEEERAAEEGSSD